MNDGDIPDRLNCDKACRILRSKVLQRIHRRLLGRIQLFGAARPAEDIGVTLVAAQPDLAVDSLLY